MSKKKKIPKPAHKYGYTYEQLIGMFTLKQMKQFGKWMEGQTCMTADDGSSVFYTCDVEAFCKKLKTGYDRQDGELLWD